VKFTLTQELADQIVFAMENQNDYFLLDTLEKEIVPADQVPDEEEVDADGTPRYQPVPDWEPADGFRVMENFLVHLNNSVWVEKLREVLSSGRRVFRRFKDTVKESPEIEKIWHRFREDEMRRHVSGWYNLLRETWGLPPLDPDTTGTEDTAQLVLEDFQIVLDESDRHEPDSPAGVAVTAWTPSGEQAGRLRARVGYAAHAAQEAQPAQGTVPANASCLSSGTRRISEIEDLFVEPEYRGLGIAATLLDRYMTWARRTGVEDVLICVPRIADFLELHLQKRGFEVASRVMELSLKP
jgi:GNAT superfamily N-acetyltransferase